MSFSLQRKIPSFTQGEAVESVVPAHTSTGISDSLPAVLSKRDLAFFALLVVVAVPDLQAMQFGGTSTMLYWVLAFVTFLLPCAYISGWLTRQAPRHVSICIWIMHFVDERWRSFFLFLLWWAGVLGVFSVVGICTSAIQPLLPAGWNNLAAQSLLFAGVLAFATLLICLPLRYLRYVLGGAALAYLAFFLLLGCAAFLWLQKGHETTVALLPEPMPGPFSWPLFSLATISLLGLNLLFFLDGEMGGAERFVRRSTRYFWWSSLIIVLLLVSSAIALMVLEPTHFAMQRGSPIQAIRLVLGPGMSRAARYLMICGSFGMVLAYLLLLSRAFLLSARLGYMPCSLARLTRAGVPFRAILAQSALIITGALGLFVVAPSLLRTFAPAIVFASLTTDDQFCLLASIGCSLLALFTALMFVFAFWVFLKKRRKASFPRHERVSVPVMCLAGFLTSFTCAFAPLTREWPSLFLSHDYWFDQVLLGLGCSLLLAWVVSEFPRRSVLLREQHLLLRREKTLREELQHTYARECDLHTRLRSAYRELNTLYREQEQAALTDCITGLPNHRACMQRLDEEVARCQHELTSCLIFFVDLDHFKAINDTWGHQAGDTILRQVAQRLREALQPGDFVGRYGGEEFALILAGATIFEASSEADRLRRVMHDTPYEWHGAGSAPVAIPVTASIGVAVYGIHGTQREELVEQADLAMYEAKLSGRDCVHVAGLHIPGVQKGAVSSRASTLSRHRQSQGLARKEESALLISPQALQALTALVRARDHTTDTHSYRLLWLAEETGRRLHASPRELFLMRLGGLFHDIGKMGIPEAILNKPGPLDEAEWEIMHRHPAIGARILEEIGGGFQTLAPMVLAHHERWDGKGYPLGLKGQEIPLPARVLSVVDAYDTMVSRRPYKDPISGNAARAELRNCAGTQFDPAVVAAFLALLENAQSDLASSRVALNPIAM